MGGDIASTRRLRPQTEMAQLAELAQPKRNLGGHTSRNLPYQRREIDRCFCHIDVFQRCQTDWVEAESTSKPTGSSRVFCSSKVTCCLRPWEHDIPIRRLKQDTLHGQIGSTYSGQCHNSTHPSATQRLLARRESFHPVDVHPPHCVDPSRPKASRRLQGSPQRTL